MDTARHGKADQLAIAALTGIASRHAGLKVKGGYDQAKAVAELHSVSIAPHLLAHAIVSPRHWQYRTRRAMLLAAGANPEDLDTIATDLDERQQRTGFPIGEGWEHPPNVEGS